jgi:ABC-type transport system substrate-binding protein
MIGRIAVLAGAGLVLGLAALAACSPVDRGPRFRPAGAATPRSGGTLRFATQGQVRTLDPTIAYDEVAYYVIQPLFDRLVDTAPDAVDIIPRLAERWEVSADGLVYTFELRAGIAFSDGAPITAAHFKFSLERALTAPDSPVVPYLGDIVGASEMTDGKARSCAGIEAVGDHRLVIRLARGNPALL